MKYAKVLKNSMDSAIGITRAAKLLGVTVNTLDRWEFEGQLIPHARMPADGRLYIEAQLHGCEIPVHNQEQLSPEAEMVQDLMTIAHRFSSCLYGLRNYRRQLNEALGQDATAGF